MSPKRLNWVQILTHIGALLPITILIWDGLTGGLTVNPIQAATIRTGKTALVLLVLSLACSPLYTVTGVQQFIPLRRRMGLYAFFYASIHFLIFIGLDYGLNWAFIQEAIFEKPFALVGFSAFLILLPLAITSTRGWQKRLRKNWKRLHRLVYGAGILVVVHYTWAVKADIRQPLAFGALVLLLLFLRLPHVRRRVSQLRFRSPRRRNQKKQNNISLQKP